MSSNCSEKKRCCCGGKARHKLTCALSRLTEPAGEEAGQWSVEACIYRTPPKLRNCADKAENMKFLIRCLAGGEERPETSLLQKVKAEIFTTHSSIVSMVVCFRAAVG